MHLIHIKQKTTIKDIQIEFNQMYPYLWIDFYAPSTFNINAVILKNKVSPEKKVLALGASSALNYLNISSNSTVEALKKEIYIKFGLNGQVLRKAGNLWITTSLTEDWSLMQQNGEGAQMELKNNTY